MPIPTPNHPRSTPPVFPINLHCTQKLREKLKHELSDPMPTDHWMGSWYAAVLMWKPQVVLLVNELTLLPVLMPLAPSSTLAQRLPAEIQRVLLGLGMPSPAIDLAPGNWSEAAVCKTASRSLVGTLNEFCFLAEAYRDGRSKVEDLLGMALRLANTPCGGAAGYRYPVDLVKQRLLH